MVERKNEATPIANEHEGSAKKKYFIIPRITIVALTHVMKFLNWLTVAKYRVNNMKSNAESKKNRK